MERFAFCSMTKISLKSLAVKFNWFEQNLIKYL